MGGRDIIKGKTHEGTIFLRGSFSRYQGRFTPSDLLDLDYAFR
jgi:hypothetical protein